MATTRLIPLHINKGRTVAQTIFDRTDYVKNPEKTVDRVINNSADYVMNPDKTKGGELVVGYGCDPRAVDEVCCKGCFRITPLLQLGGHIIRSGLRRHSRKGGWYLKIKRTAA